MKIQIVALGVLFAGALSMVAVAEEGAVKEHAKGDKGGSKFEAMDTDKNGSISLEEFKVNFAKRQGMRKAEGDKPQPTAEDVFNKLDTDKSGSLSKEEMMAGHKAKGPRPEKKAEAPAQK